MKNKKIYIIGGIVGALLISSFCGYLYLNSEERLQEKAEEACNSIKSLKDKWFCACELMASKNTFTGNEYKKFLKTISDGDIGKKKEFLHSVDDWKRKDFEYDVGYCVAFTAKKLGVI